MGLLCLYVQDSRMSENATHDLRIAISIGRQALSLAAAILNKAEGLMKPEVISSIGTVAKVLN